MITVGDKQYRNLQEQVLHNQDQIEILKSQKAISDLGIKIIQPNPLPTAQDLPTNYTGEFGDAYLVGAEAPYDLYIWTRSNEVAVPGFWFDWGPLNAPSTVPGPQGPKGDTGPKGNRGSYWISSTGMPTADTAAVYQNHDQYLRTDTGDVYMLSKLPGYAGTWQLTGNIKGPKGDAIVGPQGPRGIQGPAGPVGPQGPAGQSIQILGTLDNIGQLPDPTTVDRSATYLVTISGEEHIYLITGLGTTESPLVWHDAGTFGGGSKIIIDGVEQESVDLTDLIESPNYSPVDSTQVQVLTDKVQFSNLQTSGSTITGSQAPVNIATIELPITASTDIQPISSADSKSLEFELTQDFKDKLAQDIENAQPPIITLIGSSGTLTEEQFALLASNENTIIHYNGPGDNLIGIYRRVRNPRSEQSSDYYIFTRLAWNYNNLFGIINVILVRQDNKSWALSSQNVMKASDYYTKSQLPLYYTEAYGENANPNNVNKNALWTISNTANWSNILPESVTNKSGYMICMTRNRQGTTSTAQQRCQIYVSPTDKMYVRTSTPDPANPDSGTHIWSTWKPLFTGTMTEANGTLSITTEF